MNIRQPWLGAPICAGLVLLATGCARKHPTETTGQTAGAWDGVSQVVDKLVVKS